jgi:general secretion pathway protein D
MKYASPCFAILLAVALSAPAALAQTATTTTKPIAPLQLKPASNAPITLHMVDDSKVIYQTIGKVAGIDVLFDPDFVPKKIAVDMTNVSISDALRIVGDVSGTFYKPVTTDAILVAANSHGKHTDLDTLIDHTFYLHNVSLGSDANEIHTAIRNLLPPDARTYLVANQNAIVVSATAEQLARAEWLINELDRPKKSYRLTYTVTETDKISSSSKAVRFPSSPAPTTPCPQTPKPPVYRCSTPTSTLA